MKLEIKKARYEFDGMNDTVTRVHECSHHGAVRKGQRTIDRSDLPWWLDVQPIRTIDLGPFSDRSIIFFFSFSIFLFTIAYLVMRLTRLNDPVWANSVLAQWRVWWVLGGLVCFLLWEMAGVVIWEFKYSPHAFDQRYLSTTIYLIKSKSLKSFWGFG